MTHNFKTHPEHGTRRIIVASLLLVATALCFITTPAMAGGRYTRPKPDKVVRELLVPMEDLNVLLENQPRRVLLSREEYESLLKKARVEDEQSPPREAVLTDSQYTARLSDGRASIEGTIQIDVLGGSMQAVELDIARVGLKSATLDGKPAAIGRDKHGQLMLLVEGKGQHELRLSLTAPVKTTAATQLLSFRLPTAPSARFDLTVDGDVEVKNGLDVARRRFVASKNVTQFDLLPRGGDVSLVMTLNSRLHRKDRIVIATSVFLAALTESGEQLHATTSLSILHGAVDQFQFRVPDGFEITSVESPHLSSWAMADKDKQRVLKIRLREATTDKVVLSISATRDTPRLVDWSFPRLRPLDVDGQVAVVGLLVDKRLKPKTIRPTDLIAIDTTDVQNAVPAAMRAESRLGCVAAYYAPAGDYSLSAQFEKPTARVKATSTLLLTLSDKRQHLSGSILLEAENEPLFEVDLHLPAAWHVEHVSDAAGNPISFERHEKSTRLHARLNRGIPSGGRGLIRFVATSTPAGWLGDWKDFSVEFPEVRVLDSASQRGAIAVAVKDDLRARPRKQSGLFPLDEAEKKKFNLAGAKATLAYRHEDGRFKATMRAERIVPRLTARTYSFLRVAPGMLAAHYEIVYDVAEARARKLQFILPKSTPADLAIRGLDGVAIKQYAPEDAKEGRLWTVQLADARRGTVALAVDFQQPLGEKDPRGLPLPIVRAQGVAHQSGLFAVEGNAELDVKVTTDARPVDVGELVDATYQPGKRLLGVYSFVGQAERVAIDAYRYPAYPLSAAVVERGWLKTVVSSEGVAQTLAQFQLRSKALYLEVELPHGAELWSAWLDNQPIKPQRQDDRLLLNLAAGAATGARELRLAYEMPLPTVRLLGDVRLTAPRLLLRAEQGAPPVEVPMANLDWRLVLPWRYQVVRADGTLTSSAVGLPEPALFELARAVGLIAVKRPNLGCCVAKKDKCIPAVYESPKFLDCDSPKSEPTDGEEAFSFEESEVKCLEKLSKSGVTTNRDTSTEGGRKPPSDGISQNARQALTELNHLQREMAQHGMKLQDPTCKELQKKLADLKHVLYQKSGRSGLCFRNSRESSEKLVEQSNQLNSRLQQRIASLRHEIAVSRKKVLQEALKKKDGKKLAFDFDVDVDKPLDKRQLQVFGRRLDNDDDDDDETKIDSFQFTGRTTSAAAGLEKGTAKYNWDSSYNYGLQGVRSLEINFDDHQIGRKLPSVVFKSLGEDPSLDLTLADARGFKTLGWAVALTMLLIGLAMTGRSRRAKFRLIVIAGLFFSLLPMAPGCQVLAEPCNMAFWAVVALVPYYLVVGAVRWIFVQLGTLPAARSTAAAAGAVLLVLATALGATAAEPLDRDGRLQVELVDPGPAARVPADAILVPYDPDSPGGIEDADRCFVPFDQYKELWRRANPDKPDADLQKPFDYSLAGAKYKATLAGGDDLLLEGEIEIVVHKSSGATVPLRLAGGVLADARLDDKPARLSVTQAEPRQQRASQSAANRGPIAPRAAILLLHVPSEGRHTLRVKTRLPLTRHGGWHVTHGVVPAAPASSLVLTVPDARTDVRLDETADRRDFETKAADEQIETVLGSGGTVRLQWRPRLARSEIQQSLTAKSEARLDIQEDGTRLVWNLELEFHQDQRQQFTIGVPGDYLVEKVEGQNVRGWKSARADKNQRIDVTLLGPAKGSERFTLRLRRNGSTKKLNVPIVTVEGAAIERGRVTIWRSPLLEVQTVSTRGARRTDIVVSNNQGSTAALENPLGLRPQEAYRFASTPFAITLSVAPIRAAVTAQVQSILRIVEEKRSLESRVNLDVRRRPIYRAALLLPEGFELEDVDAPGKFSWAVTQNDKPRRLLTVFFAGGQSGRVPIVLNGSLKEGKDASVARLPRLEVLDVERQQGDVAVQVDPSFRVRSKDLKHCQSVLLRRLHHWLEPAQRSLTQLALHYDNPNYEGQLVLSRRKPRVSCSTITNVRVTERAIEETILLNFTIREAGIRRIEFMLPHWMKDCRIQVPLLRDPSIEPTGQKSDAPLHVTLDLEDEVLSDEFRVVVKNDRLPGPELHTAPIPTVLTGETTRRFVVLESAGRDEVVPDKDKTVGLESINSKSQAWQALRQFLLGGGIVQAYLANPDVKRPKLAFRMHQREAVVTAGARIGLAETDLLVDPAGAYRGRVIYHMDNRTEQLLPVMLPAGSRLWSARVANEPVKPIRHPNSSEPEHLCIPLVKTSAGELDYEVVLIYGGKMEPLGNLGSSVDFPLVRTVDPAGKLSISPEVSQVRLHLPRARRWFDFGGTMRLVENEGQLAADQVAYQNKVISRLTQTMRSGDEFAKVRAAENLVNISTIGNISSVNNDSSEYNNLGVNDARLQKELVNNEKALEEARRQAQVVQNAPEKDIPLDNRAQFDKLFKGQTVNPTRGAVVQAGKNWTRIAGPASGPQTNAEGRQKGVKLGKQWFQSNNFVQQPAPPAKQGQWGYMGRQSGKHPASTPSAARPQRMGESSGSFNIGYPAAATEPTLPGLGTRDSKGKRYSQSRGMNSSGKFSLGVPQAKLPAESKPAVPKKRSSKLSRYIKKYKAEQALALPQQRSQSSNSPTCQSGEGINDTPLGGGILVDAVDESVDFSRVDVSNSQSTCDGGGAGGRGRARADAEQPVVPTGLASLCIDLPEIDEQYYETYLFTTPRGDVSISARPGSTELIRNSRNTLLVLIGFGLLVLLARTRFVRWLGMWHGGLTLMVVGLLLTISCMVPLLGILLVGIGTIVLITTRKPRANKQMAAQISS